MYIKDIELKDYRNYKDIRVSFSDKVNIFLGNNAQGKTNLLESIYLNAMAKSFKTNKDKELIRFGQEFCKVRSTTSIDDEDHITEILITKDGKKGIKSNGVKIRKTSQMLERIYIIIFSPEDMKIVKDEPEKRRKFIDRELCLIKPGYYNDLSNYKKVLKQRNTYLKEMTVDPDMLDIWDQQLADYGSKIMIQRKSFIDEISDTSSEIHKGITNNKEILSLKYDPNIEYNDDLKIQKDIFYNKLKDSFENDMKMRTTTIELKKIAKMKKTTY